VPHSRSAARLVLGWTGRSRMPGRRRSGGPAPPAEAAITCGGRTPAGHVVVFSL